MLDSFLKESISKGLEFRLKATGLSFWEDSPKRLLDLEVKKHGGTDQDVEAIWESATALLARAGHKPAQKYRRLLSEDSSDAEYTEDFALTFVESGVQTGSRVRLKTVQGEAEMEIREMLTFSLFQAKIMEYCSFIYPSAYKRRHEHFVAEWVKRLSKVTMLDEEHDSEADFLEMFREFVDEKVQPEYFESKVRNGVSAAKIEGQIVFKEKLLRKFVSHEDLSPWSRKKLLAMLKKVFKSRFNPNYRFKNIRLYAIAESQVQHDGGSGKNDETDRDLPASTGAFPEGEYPAFELFSGDSERIEGSSDGAVPF